MKAIRTLFFLIVLLMAVDATAQINMWRDLYKVKKKDTLYGIAQQYGLTVDELKEANPEMAAEGFVLRKGDTVFIPYAKSETADGKPAVAKPSNTARLTSQPADDVRKRPIRVGVLLPLHNVDGDGRRMVEYYRGLLLACDSLKREGISTEMHAWNVPADADISQFLNDDVARCDLLFGPLYTTQVKPMADFCRAHNMRMVIPFSIKGDDVYNYEQIFQVYQSQAEIDSSAVDAFMERFPDAHPIIVDCGDATSGKGHFTRLLRDRLEAKGISYNLTSLQSSDDDFAKAFDPTLPNVVVLNSGSQQAINAAFTALNGLTAQNSDYQVSMFGYKEWLTYFRTNRANFYKYDVYVPTPFYYNPSISRTTKLEQTYKSWFGQPMQHVMPKFALTGVDHGMFFLRGLHLYGNEFVGTKAQNATHHVQTPLRFRRQGSGGYKNDAFMLIHYTQTGKIQAINYY